MAHCAASLWPPLFRLLAVSLCHPALVQPAAEPLRAAPPWHGSPRINHVLHALRSVGECTHHLFADLGSSMAARRWPSDPALGRSAIVMAVGGEPERFYSRIESAWFEWRQWFAPDVSPDFHLLVRLHLCMHAVHFVRRGRLARVAPVVRARCEPRAPRRLHACMHARMRGGLARSRLPGACTSPAPAAACWGRA